MSKNQVLLPLSYKDKVWDHYFFDPKTSIIYYEARIDGKRIKFSTRETNPLKAKVKVNIELKERLGINKRNIKTLISDELESWLLFKESEGHKYDTLNNIRRAKGQIQEFWGDMLPSEINRDSFAEWCAYWKVHHSEKQMENAVKYFNNFCRYLHEKVVNDRPLLLSLVKFHDPNRHQIKASRAKKKENVLTHEDFKKIHSTALDEADALIVHIMYTMATRIDETLKLDFTGRILLDHTPPIYRWTYGNNKARKVGEHALHSTLIEPLRKLRERRKSEGTDLLFPQKGNLSKPISEQHINWGDWRQRSKVSFHWTPHTFKHTCLTNLFNDPRNPQAIICKLYRTSLQVALETYIKVSPDSVIAMKDSIKVDL